MEISRRPRKRQIHRQELKRDIDPMHAHEAAARRVLNGIPCELGPVTLEQLDDVDAGNLVEAHDSDCRAEELLLLVVGLVVLLLSLLFGWLGLRVGSW